MSKHWHVAKQECKEAWCEMVLSMVVGGAERGGRRCRARWVGGAEGGGRGAEGGGRRCRARWSEVQSEVVGGAEGGGWRCRVTLLEVQKRFVEDPAGNACTAVSVFASITKIMLGMSLQAC